MMCLKLFKKCNFYIKAYFVFAHLVMKIFVIWSGKAVEIQGNCQACFSGNSDMEQEEGN